MLKTQAFIDTEKINSEIHEDINTDFSSNCQEAIEDNKVLERHIYTVEQEHIDDKTIVELLKEFITLKVKSH